jgi:hypothetical protein
VSIRRDGVHVEVTLSDAGDGTVQVAIEGAGRLGVERALLFGIAANSQDYLVVLKEGGAALGRWDGATWAPFDHHALAPKAAAGRFTFSLAFDDLGARAFDYWIAAVRGDDVEAAPDWGRFTSLSS